LRDAWSQIPTSIITEDLFNCIGEAEIFDYFTGIFGVKLNGGQKDHLMPSGNLPTPLPSRNQD
jgi:hypothetical protein